MTDQAEVKTIGLTPFIFCADKPLFRVNGGVPVDAALAMASDLLFLAKALSKDAAYDRETDRFSWAAHYLTSMGKAAIDDVVKSVTPPPVRPSMKVAK